MHRPLARHSGASSYTPRPQVLSPRQRQLAQRQAGTCRQRQRASGAACSEAISFLELLGEHAAIAVAVEEARQHVAPRRRAHLSAASDRKRGARPVAGERTRRSTRTYVPPPTAVLSRHMNESTFPSECSGSPSNREPATYRTIRRESSRSPSTPWVAPIRPCGRAAEPQSHQQPQLPQRKDDTAFSPSPNSAKRRPPPRNPRPPPPPPPPPRPRPRVLVLIVILPPWMAQPLLLREFKGTRRGRTSSSCSSSSSSYCTPTPRLARPLSLMAVASAGNLGDT